MFNIVGYKITKRLIGIRSRSTDIYKRDTPLRFDFLDRIAITLIIGYPLIGLGTCLYEIKNGIDYCVKDNKCDIYTTKISDVVCIPIAGLLAGIFWPIDLYYNYKTCQKNKQGQK